MSTIVKGLPRADASFRRGQKLLDIFLRGPCDDQRYGEREVDSRYDKQCGSLCTGGLWGVS